MDQIVTPAFITEDECRDISSMMAKKYAGTIGDRFFETKIQGDDSVVSAQIVLRNKSGSFFYPVEGRLAYANQNLAKREAGLILLDYIDLYFDEYLRDDDVFLPIDWADYESDEVRLQLKGQIMNLELEKMADAFLEERGIGSELH